MYLILLLFRLLLVSDSVLKVQEKGGCAFGAFNSDIGDVAGFEKGAYDSEFVEIVGGGDALKDFVGVYFVLLFLYRFGLYLVSDSLFCVFVLRLIRICLRMLILIPILKMVLLKMVFMVMKC